MSAPSLSLIILSLAAYYLGPVVLGCICGRLRRIGLLFPVLPPVILIAIWPGLVHPGALPLFITYSLLAVIGYIVGFLW